MTPNFVFYDYETTGIDPAMDRPIQFAACRASADFAPIDQHEFKCRLAGDVIPSPHATLVHGQSPAVLQRDGLTEREFADRINQLFCDSPQIILGYNTASFDDPFTQHLMYRNFQDPYAWQYSDGNLRYDLIVAVRAAYLLANDALIWPEREGQVSMKLEDLAPANDISHLNAHDALGDTLATRDLAARLAANAPELWQECLSMASKRVVQSRIEQAMAGHGAVLMIDASFGRDRAYAGLVYPIGVNPAMESEVWCIDLGMDLAPLADYTPAQLREAMYTPASQRLPDTPRVPLKRIRTNKACALFPLEILAKHPDALGRAGIDREHFKTQRALVRGQSLQHWMGLAEAILGGDFPVSDWADAQLYDGLFSRADQAKMRQVRSSQPVDLMADPPTFDDPRLNALLPLYLARNFPDQLGPKAWRDWTKYRTARWQGPVRGRGMDIHKYTAAMQEMAGRDNLTEDERQWLFELETWVQREAPPL